MNVWFFLFKLHKHIGFIRMPNCLPCQLIQQWSKWFCVRTCIVSARHANIVLSVPELLLSHRSFLQLGFDSWKFKSQLNVLELELVSYFTSIDHYVTRYPYQSKRVILGHIYKSQFAAKLSFCQDRRLFDSFNVWVYIHKLAFPTITDPSV